MKSNLWNYLLGYVKINIEGLSLEKFLNLTAKKNIRCYDVFRNSSTSIECYVVKQDFAKLRKVLRDSRSKLTVKEKIGLPFILNPFKKRKTLLIGAVAFIIALFVSSQFIWQIEVEGNHELNSEEIISYLHGAAKIGNYKKNIDLNEIKRAVELGNKKIAWSGVRLYGTKLIINVVESIDEPQILQDEDYSCNIIASKDAQITQIITENGIEAATVGQNIKKGETIISGILPEEMNAPLRYTNARGTVKGKVWYSASAFIAKKSIVKVRSQKSEQILTVDFLGQQYTKEPAFKDFESEKINENNIENFFIPIYIKTERIYELVDSEKELTQQEMKQMSAQNALQDVLRYVPDGAEITYRDVQYSVDENGVTAVYVVEAIEEIGEVAPIS